MSMTHVEQTKLSATFVSGIGLAVLAVGGFAPIIAAIYTADGVTLFHLAVGAVCMVIGVALHLLARLLLRRLPA